MIWLLSGNPISTVARQAIDHPPGQVWLSTVSIWEVLIKHRAGRLWIDKTSDAIIETIAAQSYWKMLRVEMSHLRELASLEYFSDHKDPFDRLLIAQAQAEGLSIVTSDGDFARYPVSVIW